MAKRKSMFALFMALFSFYSFDAHSQGKIKRGTPAEAIQMVEDVKTSYIKVGAEKTFLAITAQKKPFQNRDLYPVVFDFKGVYVAHGAKRILVGKSQLNVVDRDNIPFIKQMIKVIRQRGRGWVTYSWPNPLTKTIIQKTTYVEKLGKEYIVGVGIYKGLYKSYYPASLEGDDRSEDE